MTILLKLVGFPEYEIKDSFEGKINLNMLVQLFMHFGFCLDEIKHLRFIIDSEQITSSEQIFLINNETKIIFILSPIIELKNKLKDIFQRVGYKIESNDENDIESNDENDIESNDENDNEINQPLPETNNNIITSEMINNINMKTIILFSDDDFKKLINIYKKRPELFSVLAKYTNSGNIIEESFTQTKSIDDLTYEELCHYKELSIVISNLNLGVSDEIIINRLIKYSGHLNLTVRSILNEFA